MKKEAEYFCQRYNAHLKPSKTLYYRSKPIQYAQDYNKTSINDVIQRETEPGVEINMSLRDFEFLLELHNTLEELKYSTPDRLRGRGIEHFLAQHEKEIKLRNRYPHLKEMHEQYQTMLRLLDDSR